MILVAPDTGSVQYLQLLRNRGLRAEYDAHGSVDISFVGSGPNDTPTLVAIEIKKLSDLLRCIADNRFAGVQLGPLQENYGAAWLLVEGIWKASDSGELVQWFGGRWQPVKWGKRVWQARDVEHWLMTQEIKGGMRIHRSPSETETARWIHCLWSWWCASDWDEHRSHLAVYDRPLVERVETSKPTDTMRILRGIPGIAERSRQLAGALGGRVCPKLCEWSPAEWATALGIKDKKSKLAEKVWGVLHGPVRTGHVGQRREEPRRDRGAGQEVRRRPIR